MEVISGIYMIINLKNGKCYIGSSKDIKGRWKYHKKALNNRDHFNPYLQNSWNKYREDNFKFVILEKTKNRLDREQFFIDKYEPEYNVLKNVKATPTQENSGCKEETINKMSEAQKGSKHTEKTKQKMSESHKGRERSKETKQRIRKTLKGEELSEETKQKLSEAHKGKRHTKQTKRKISKANQGEKSPTSKLTEEEVLKIRKLTNYIYDIKIAKIFKVSQSAINNIKNRKTWKHI